MRALYYGLAFLISTATASQMYVPPPPPKFPLNLSEEAVERGRLLFQENVLKRGELEIYNYLGKQSCASCHDQEIPLKREKLAQEFSSLRTTINQEIELRMEGQRLAPDGPDMEALVQFMIQNYRLQDFKLLK